jgi:predicted nucleic acid-binding protein
MSLVLDSSIALSWLLTEEAAESSQYILAQVTERGAWVPSLWRLEISNSLEMGIRRGRLDEQRRDSMFANLRALPIQVDSETEQHAWGATARLARQYHLTAYDAAYMELAQRRGLPLATLDTALLQAARVAGVIVLGSKK